MSGYCLRTSTIATMSDYEDDFGDFPSQYKKESLVGAYRAESTLQYTAGSESTKKIPPLFDWSTSWLTYEELIEYWLDLTLNNRLVVDAEMYKGLLNRESLRATGGVKYFRASLRLRFIKGAHNGFL